MLRLVLKIEGQL